MKKLITLFLVFTLMFSAFAINVSAQCSLSINVSKTQVYVGDTVKVTLIFSASAPVESADINFSFDNGKMQYTGVSGGVGTPQANVQGKTIIVSDYRTSFEGNAPSTYTLVLSFKATAVGSATFNVNSSDIGDADFKTLGTPTGAKSVSVMEQNKSSDCNLKWLTVPDGCTLVPKFSPSITSYTCTVPYTVTKFPMDWAKSDPDAKDSVTPLTTLKVGENTRVVTVTAPDGSKKSYTVKVTRLEAQPTPVPTPTHVPTPSPVPTPTAPPVTVTVDNVTYTLVSDITLELPEGFKEEIYKYNVNDIETAVLGELRLVQLFDGSKDSFFIYSEKTQEFVPYAITTISEKKYTVLSDKPENIPYELKQAHLIIGEDEYTAWTCEKLDEGYYIVNVVNSLGEKYAATYCKADGTIQKLSQKLLSMEASAGVTVSPDAEIITPTAKPLFAEPINIDWLLVGVIAAGLILIGLIILLIVLIARDSKKKKALKASRDWGFEEENDPYNIEITEPEPVVMETEVEDDTEDDDFS